jgi:hypothetical protein
MKSGNIVGEGFRFRRRVRRGAQRQFAQKPRNAEYNFSRDMIVPLGNATLPGISVIDVSAINDAGNPKRCERTPIAQ